VTSYVAAVWIDALRRLVPVAAHLGDDSSAKRMAHVLARAERALESLRGPDGVLALHRDGAGRLSADRTAMAAVPIALRVGASSSDHDLLEDLASPRYSAPWGLRMLPVDDPRYHPRGYHTGSAWPLFTGWAALADCATGAVDRGFERVRSLAGAAMAGGTGGFAEVLDGDTGERAGVCPDQAWSAAMILTPIVCGVAGVEPDALNGGCAIRGRTPATARDLRLDQVRVGETRFDVRWSRGEDGRMVAVTHREGPVISLRLSDVVAPVLTCAVGKTVSWALPDEAGR
jgi:glycogen debranching enzyme